MRSLWDISPSVSTRAPVFPGDTPFQVLWNERINDGGVANISTIHMSPHVGAHVDAPMHLDSGAVDVATLRLERFIGRCRVIDLSGADSAVVYGDAPGVVEKAASSLKEGALSLWEYFS